MKNRQELAEYFGKAGFNIGAEIGVCDGRYSEVLLKANPRLHLYGVDPFVAYKDYTDYQKKTTIDTYHEKAHQLLDPYGTRYTFIEQYSMVAVVGFPDDFFDFVYIDGNHRYDFVKQDIEEWAKKVRVGGIVAGDDYTAESPGHEGVVRAVNEYVEKHGYGLHLTTGEKPINWYFTKFRTT